MGSDPKQTMAQKPKAKMFFSLANPYISPAKGVYKGGVDPPGTPTSGYREPPKIVPRKDPVRGVQKPARGVQRPARGTQRPARETQRPARGTQRLANVL